MYIYIYVLFTVHVSFGVKGSRIERKLEGPEHFAGSPKQLDVTFFIWAVYFFQAGFLFLKPLWDAEWVMSWIN